MMGGSLLRRGPCRCGYGHASRRIRRSPGCGRSCCSVDYRDGARDRGPVRQGGAVQPDNVRIGSPDNEHGTEKAVRSGGYVASRARRPLYLAQEALAAATANPLDPSRCRRRPHWGGEFSAEGLVLVVHGDVRARFDHLPADEPDGLVIQYELIAVEVADPAGGRQPRDPRIQRRIRKPTYNQTNAIG